MGLADQIREFVRSRYIEPARERGDAQIYVKVGDVHRAMNLSNRYPAVCSALRSDTLQQDCGINLVDWSGPDQSSASTATFAFVASGSSPNTAVSRVPSQTSEEHSGSIAPWRTFQDLPRLRMEAHYQTTLTERHVPGVPKKFDFVASDRAVVGDAKFLTLIRGTGAPPAKNMEIAGHVWLLEKTQAKSTFLIFGNQREVVVGWLKKYGSIAGGVEFWFLDGDGALERLR